MVKMMRKSRVFRIAAIISLSGISVAADSVLYGVFLFCQLWSRSGWLQINHSNVRLNCHEYLMLSGQIFSSKVRRRLSMGQLVKQNHSCLDI